MRSIIITAVAIFLQSVAFQVSAADTVTIPKGYEKWEKSRDKTVADKSSLFYGIHNIYVDSKAMRSYRTGGSYPEGSQFVVVQYAIKDSGGRPVKGRKSMIVLMRKDSRQKVTGGWLFAGFTPDGKPGGLDPVKNCFECHAKDAASTDFIISRYGDFK